MTLLVRNEEDIIRENILFHSSCGVEAFVVTDNRSTDSTIEIVRSLSHDHQITLWTEDGDDYSQGKWVTTMARHAASAMGADWVINADADEFFVAIDLDLPGFFEREGGSGTDVMYVERVNMEPVRSEIEPFYERMVYCSTPSTNIVGRPLGPKSVHRASPDITVAQGNHQAWAPHFAAPRRTRQAEIVHYPLRSYAQFESKIALGGAALERNSTLTADVNAPWRHAFDLYRSGRLRDLYAAREVVEEMIPAELATGGLRVDHRVRDALRRVAG